MGQFTMDSIFELFKGILSIPAPFNMIVVIVLICCTTGVITSLFKQIRKYSSYRHDVYLKRELVERGLSVEEIERIVSARGSATSKDSCA
jgi:hypothetical protein